MTARAEECLAVAKRLIDALTRLDTDAMLALLHEDILLEVVFPLVKGENTTGSRRQAGKAVHEYVREVKRRTKEIRFENALWRTTNDGLAMFQADGNHILSDGRPYPNHYLFLFKVADGKIIHWWEYLNPVAAMRAFGGPLDAIP